MLRYIVPVIIAALAFTIGVGWVYNFGLLKPNSPAEGQTVVQPPTVAASPTPLPVLPEEPKLANKVKFLCRDKVFSFVLDHLRDAEDPDLGEDYVDGFIEALRIGNCTELFEIENRIDLNGDGRKEIILRTKNSSEGNFYCGATGNCPFWVLRPVKGGYKILLDAYVAKEVQVQSQKTSGYKNLVTCFDCGMLDRTLGHFNYSGGKYNLRKCVADRMDIYGKSYLKRRKLSECR